MKKYLLVLIGAVTLTQAFADYAITPAQQVDFTLGESIPVFGSKSPSQTLGQVAYHYTAFWFCLEAGAGGWAGSRSSGIANAQIGLNYKDFSIGTGPAYITTTSSFLGTHRQFMSTARWTFNPMPIYVEWNHVSNARRILGGPGPNAGENFVALGYAHAF